MTVEEAIKILDYSRIQADCERDTAAPLEAEKERDRYIEACSLAIEALRCQKRFESVTIACPHGATINLSKLGSEGALFELKSGV